MILNTCCGINLRIGAMILGKVGVILSFLGIVYLSSSLFFVQYATNKNENDKNIVLKKNKKNKHSQMVFDDFCNAALIVGLVYLIINFISSILLIYSSCKVCLDHY